MKLLFVTSGGRQWLPARSRSQPGWSPIPATPAGETGVTIRPGARSICCHHPVYQWGLNVVTGKGDLSLHRRTCRPCLRHTTSTTTALLWDCLVTSIKAKWLPWICILISHRATLFIKPCWSWDKLLKMTAQVNPFLCCCLRIHSEPKFHKMIT